MIINLGLLVGGLVLLVIGSNYFVNASSSLASHFKVPKFVIGLSVIAFGTCFPELAISFSSIISNNTDITLANVFGSNICNILLIVGVGCVIRPLKIKKETIKKELPYLILVTSVFCMMMLKQVFNHNITNDITRVDGLILIVLFIILCLFIISETRKNMIKEIDIPKYSKLVSFIILILSIIGISLVSNLVVSSAVNIANYLHISQKVISMSLIAIGTSLPELIITITCARKNEFDMAIGNIIGTNIFNICIVIGLPIIIFGTRSTVAFSYLDVIMIFISALVLYLFSKSKKEISRTEGMLMLILFFVYYLYIFLI